VVGIAAAIHPATVAPEVLSRDVLTMTILTFLLFVFCFGFSGPGRINRLEGAILLVSYIGYTAFLIIKILDNG